MKRPSDTDMPDVDGKRQASSDEGMFVLRILCPVEHAGSLIGQGGEVIKSIRSDSDAYVKIEDFMYNCEERIVRIASEDSCLGEKSSSQEALTTVIEKLAEAEGDKADDADFTVRLLIWSTQSGCIIGKGGETIAKLRETTGADVRILPRRDIPLCASVEDDTVCQIVGSYDNVCNAVEAVTALLRENSVGHLPSRRPIVRPAPNSSSEIKFRMLIPYGKAGNLIGKGGQGVLQKLRDETGSVVRINNTFDGEDEYRVVIFRSSVTGRICAAQEALLRCMYFLNEQEPGVKNTARILVPAKEVGSVLGKKGSTIQSIREETAAFIRIVDDSEVPEVAKGEKMILVQGTPTQVGEAVRSLTCCLISSPTRTSAGSPGNNKSSKSNQTAGRDFADLEVVNIDISPEMVGALIGKGGSNITQIRTISEASVKLLEDPDANGNRQLEIRGTPNECRAAANMVKAFLAKVGDVQDIPMTGDVEGRVVAVA